MQIALFAAMLCIAITDCASSQLAAPDWVTLEQCVHGESFLVQGGLLYANFTINADCDATSLAREIKRGLEMEIESGKWPYDALIPDGPDIAKLDESVGDVDESLPITEREYWALVLAYLTDTDYVVRIFETETERKKRLHQFLASIDLDEKSPP